MSALASSPGCLTAAFAAHSCLATTRFSTGNRKSFCRVGVTLPSLHLRSGRRGLVVCMAPEEEKMTRRSPLDFPIEWERPKPGRRPDIFPRFSPMKTPLPTPLPADPPEEDEEEEEEKKEEEEEDPEKDDPGKPEKET